MKRTFATTTFAFAILGVTACKGGAGDAAKFIPEAANAVGGADVAALQNTALWKDNFKAKFEAQSQEQMAAMNECKVGLDKIKSVTLGTDVNSGGGKMAVVVTGEGIGNKANLECMHGKLKEKMGGNDPWTSEEDGKVLKNVMGEGNVVHVIDDGKIVYATKDWADSVGKLIKGEGKSAFEGSLKDVIAQTDTSKHLWGAGMAPEGMMGPAAAQLGATPKSMAGWVDVSGDVSFKMVLGLGSGDEAEKVKATVDGLWTGMGKEMAKAQGLTDGALDSIKFGTDGNGFTVEGKVPEAEVKSAISKMPGM